jgi:hypothetical protein
LSLRSLLKKQMQVVDSSKVRMHGAGTNFDYDGEGPVYPCDLQPVEATKQMNFQQMGIDATHMLFWNPADVTVASDKRFIVDGIPYKLASSSQPSLQRPGWPSKAFVVEARL